MIKSELILPIRIYDSLFDQNRFHRYCDPEKEYEVIAASTSPPHFQFKRTASLNIPAYLVLRNVCNDPSDSYKLVPESAENFGSGPQTESYWGAFPKLETGLYDDGVNPPSSEETSVIELATCGGITNGDLTNFDFSAGGYSGASVVMPVTASSPGNKYYVKIVVDKMTIAAGSGFRIKIYSGTEAVGTLLYTIAAAGSYGFEFYADTYDDISVVFDDLEDGDEFLVSYINATLLTPIITQFTGDIAIDDTAVTITRLPEGEDVITYCESAVYNITPGSYYFILGMNIQGSSASQIQEVYFSEVFTVKSAKDLVSYYRLTWYNTAKDLTNIIYTGGCLIHSLYLDSALFNPQYLTEEEVEPNGEGDLNTTFRRWQKTITFEIAKSPMFLTDALSGVFLHDIITLKHPHNRLQDVENDETEILRVETSVTDILENCFQAVKMTLTQAEKYTQTNCENAIELFDCVAGPYTIAITNVTESPTGVFSITGNNAVPYSHVVVEYNVDAAGYVTSTTNALVTSTGTYVVVFDSTVLGAYTDLKIRILNKTIDCTFGTTDEEDVV